MSLQGRGPEVWGCRGEQMMGLILDTWNTRYIFFKHGGLFESNSHRVKHFSYDVRSNEFRSQFTCGQLERDVLGGQPNLLTPNIKWGLRTVTVCLRLVPLASLDKGLSGEPPYPEASLNERMRGWNNGWTPLRLSGVGQLATASTLPGSIRMPSSYKINPKNGTDCSPAWRISDSLEATVILAWRAGCGDACSGRRSGCHRGIQTQTGWPYLWARHLRVSGRPRGSLKVQKA